MKGFIEVTDLEDGSPVLVNVNSILYVFSESFSESDSKHAVLFYGFISEGRRWSMSVTECLESYQTVRAMIEQAIGY